ncbi:MAG: hypothetical protein SGILL_001222 [Bacillariaceae sp.]
MSEGVEKELTNINENEAVVNSDSDCNARSHSPGRSCSGGSVASGGSTGSSGSKQKRRSWKKPKDKPKRPLSAYNIFFKHERSRIVEGRPDEATPEETIRSIEIILSTSRETRRHRKTHGRISFGDLARRIADKWKGITSEHKSLFEHYAEIDMRRYRKEVQLWKDKKEAEARGSAGSGQEGSANSNSLSDSISEYSESGADPASHDPWAPRKNFYDNMSSSFSTVDSEVSFDHLPMQMQLQMMQQQQLRQQQMQLQMNNSGLNMHASMPNLSRISVSDGMSPVRSFVPNGVQSGGNFGQSYEQELSPADLIASNNDISMSNMNMLMSMQQRQGLNQGIGALHNSFSGRPSFGAQQQQQQRGSIIGSSVPFVIGGDQNGGDFQQLNSGIGFESSVNDLQQPQADPAFSFHDVASPPPNGINLDPVPFDQVFPDDFGGDMGNILSNLDLSTT